MTAASFSSGFRPGSATAAGAGVVRRVNGPLVEVELAGLSMAELVEIGARGLPAEVVALRVPGDHAGVRVHRLVAPGRSGPSPGPPVVGPARSRADRQRVRRPAAPTRRRRHLARARRAAGRRGARVDFSSGRDRRRAVGPGTCSARSPTRDRSGTGCSCRPGSPGRLDQVREAGPCGDG